MWITHRKSNKKSATASKPVVEQKEAVVTPQVAVEEEHQPIVKPAYKIVKKNPYLNDEETDLLEGFVVDEK